MTILGASVGFETLLVQATRTLLVLLGDIGQVFLLPLPLSLTFSPTTDFSPHPSDAPDLTPFAAPGKRREEPGVGKAGKLGNVGTL